MGSQQSEVYQKIYNKLSGDFYAEKTGDRSLALLLNDFLTTLNKSDGSNQNQIPHHSLSDFIQKIKECVVSSCVSR